MKKSILLALLALLLLVMVGCGGGNAEEADEPLGWRSQEEQMAYMPTFSEFLRDNDPVLFFSAREIHRERAPHGIYFFHNGQLLTVSGMELTFGELSNMTDDEIIVAIQNHVNSDIPEQNDRILELEREIRSLREDILRGLEDSVFYFADNHGIDSLEAIEEFYMRIETEGITERMIREVASEWHEVRLLGNLEEKSRLEAELELEQVAFGDTVFPADLVAFFTTPYFLSVRADGTGNNTEHMTLTFGSMSLTAPAEIRNLQLSTFGAFGIVYDAVYVGFRHERNDNVFVTRTTDEWLQILASPPRSEGVETDVDAARARLEEELQSRALPQ